MSTILDIHDLSASYDQQEILKHVSIHLEQGQVLGIVGESGSGKTTLLNCILQLDKYLCINGGQLRYKDINLLQLSTKERRQLYRKDIATIFQSSNEMLVPTRRIQDQFYETTKGLFTKKETKEKAISLFEQFALENPERILHSYPFELSLGMAQRVAIALALIHQPKLLLCDEPTSALDVKNANEVMELLRMYKEKEKMSMLLITHHLGLAGKLCDDIAVMYRGEIVEHNSAETIFSTPHHPYTKQLLHALPKVEQV
ncbi:MAG: ABC transporter ATP-binding protein [Erysipelotrichaceae bacterium]|nr:ABC transporter ATP-binding protein [Erysipelotrichaceae bacterium]MDY6035331.1 ABC transporter ATP-binding protein [Bulleidia sp.]